MDKIHPLNLTEIVRFLKVDEDPFYPREEGEKVLGLNHT